MSKLISIKRLSTFLSDLRNLFATITRVAGIEEKIPTQASAQNKLADVNFVNSTVQTETAHFRGNYESVADLPLTGAGYHRGRPTNNDYMVIQDTTGVESHEPSPLYDETGAYVAGNVRVAENEFGDLSFWLCTEDNDYDDPKPPATSPDYWEELAWWPAAAGGTWRFKYSGVWEDDGVQGWSPEYQVNEEPLTAAQIAALNSNITEALTNKLVALPAKPVDTASQALTEAEKAQARTNIGATAPEVFWAVYGSTTHAEVAAAVSAGKVVMMRYNNKDYHLVISNTASAFYFSCLYSDLLYRISLTTGNLWDAEISIRAQQVANLVTSWQATPDNTHYPSEKLVYDNLYKPGKVSQTITWSGSGASAEYALSDIVTGNVPVALIEEAAVYGVIFNTTTGYFEYGGYTDIAADEMREAIAMRVAHIKRQAYQSYAGRIILPPLSAEDGAVSAFYNVKYAKYIPACIITDSRSSGNNQFAQSKKLEEVDFIIAGYSWPTTPFGLCESLKSFKVNALTTSISVPDSPLITVECIKYIVDKRTNTASPVTITLHATAYARMAADTTEYTYGGQTYTGIVAYANAKNITIASA